MKNIRRFLIKYSSRFMALALFLMIGVFTMAMAGCGAPTWLTNASQIIGMVATSFSAIGAFIAGLTGNVELAAGLAVINDWLQKVTTGISDIEELVDQYNAAPNATLLEQIEAALSDLEGHLVQDFSNLGLPQGILNVVAGISALALSQLQAWGSLIPALKANAMQTFTIKTPFTKAEYRDAVNKILTTPTGDSEVDAALAKVKKL